MPSRRPRTRRARRRVSLPLLVVCLALLILFSVGYVGATGYGPPPAPTEATSPPSLAGLSPAQLAGQRVIYSYHGLEPPPALFTRIRQAQAAGVIFFRENIQSSDQIAAVIDRLQAARLQSPVRTPLLMMTDQEGGKVRRLPGPPELSAKKIGESADGEVVARQAGTEAGVNLRGARFNLNLAPVLDVYRTPGNFIDKFERSFSNDPSRVSSLASAFIAAQQRTGVAATAKHFPGLGAAPAGQDTDGETVTLDLPLGELSNVDMLPYRAAIQGGVQLVMASWAVYPALDSARPAGLSSRIIQGQLRGGLGFRGVTITDAMEAGALKPFGTIEQRTLLAAQAGMDLMLFSARDFDQGDQGLGALTDALARRSVSPKEFRASVARILALRAQLSER
jgi:beta-N-acetylhexosaminidase